MKPPTTEQAAEPAVTAIVDGLVEQGGPPGDTRDANRFLADTDVGTVALLTGVLVWELGDPARAVLRKLAISAAEWAAAR